MQLTIRVGAAVDRSLSEAFRPLLASASKAKDALERSSQATAASRVRATRAGVSAEEREYAKLVKQTEKWRADEVKAADKAAKDRVKVAEKAAAAEVAAQERAERDKARATERALAEQRRAKEREARDESRRQHQAILSHHRANEAAARDRARMDAALGGGVRAVGGALGRGARAALGFAGSVAGDIARGAGVETDFGSIVRRNAQLETQATDLSNAGFMSGDARNGLRVDPRTLMSQTFAVGKETGTDANDIMEGLQKFVAKTGDLATGRDILRDMAVLAKATGSNMSDVADAAGDVAANIPEGADKAEKVKQVMTAIAAQGKVGAVEIKQLAVQMAKLSAASTQFEGGAAKNMAVFGAMAQIARQKGGASSASIAANTVSAFTATFTKGARLDAFDKFGVKVLGEGNKTRDQKAIILDAIRAANDKKFGGPANANRNMAEMFREVNARRAVQGWETIYSDAGGGEKGLKAVSEAFDTLVQATIAQQEAAESFAAAMKTPQSQAEVFNQTMRETTMRMTNELTPALVAMAPQFVAAAKAAADFVSWVTGNSQVGAQLRTTGSNVSAVTTAANAAIKTGTIDPAQQALGRRSEAEAQATLDAAKADVEKAKADAMSKPARAALNFIDGTGAGAVLGRALGLGQGVGSAAIQKNDEKRLDAESRQAAAEALWKQIHESNEKVANLLSTGVLKVKVEGGGAPGAPGVSDAGRQPAPGQ